MLTQLVAFQGGFATGYGAGIKVIFCCFASCSQLDGRVPWELYNLFLAVYVYFVFADRSNRLENGARRVIRLHTRLGTLLAFCGSKKRSFTRNR
jgi:hypothetical protein